MLTIRMQRKGRSGHAQFRVVVQDSRFHPSSGRVVAYVGSYDPHTKATTLNGEKISAYLTNGAQPSDRVAKLLQKEGIKLPDWFKPAAPKKGEVRNPEKRRSTRPAGATAPVKAEQEAPAEVAAEPATSNQENAEPQAEDVASDEPKEPAEQEKGESQAENTDEKPTE